LIQLSGSAMANSRHEMVTILTEQRIQIDREPDEGVINLMARQTGFN
jgi:hypothetical protein